MLVRNLAAMSVTSARKVVPIDIVSDTVCPWCFVGKRRMEKAIQRFKSRPEGKDVEFEVTWKPFQLNPDLPQDDPGHNKMEMYIQKFGRARIEAMVPTMTETFAESGAGAYSMGGNTGSTLNSHRLIHWANKHHGRQAQDKLVEELFKGYFTQEQFINDQAFLQAAAEQAGLPADQVRAVLEDPAAERDEVQKELREARMQAISGVPNFLINNQYQLSGAQNPETFEQVFAEAVA